MTKRWTGSDSGAGARIVFGVLLLSAAAAGFELRTYRSHVVVLDSLDPHAIDLVLAYLSLWARTLMWLIVPTAIALVLAHRGRPGVGAVVGLGAACIFAVWFVVDARLVRQAGIHVDMYVQAAWGADWSDWRLFVRVAAGPLALFGAACVVHGLLPRIPGFGRLASRSLRPLVIFYVLVPIVGLTARGLVREPAVLERLYEVMLWRVPLQDPDRVPGSSVMAFGVPADATFDRAAELFRSRMDEPTVVTFERIGGVSPRSEHVVILVVESFRRDALGPEHMPRISAWARKGFVAERHFAVSNRSELATFALLYGRLPIAYDGLVRSERPPTPALIRLFRDAGYTTTLAATCRFEWLHMNAFFGAPPFDAEHLSLPRSDRSMEVDDREALATVRRTLREANGHPQLVVAYLMSTHHEFSFPSTDGSVRTSSEDDVGRNTPARMERYQGALRFLDDALGDLVQSLTGDGHLVVLTGDHGESFGEDGGYAHATKLSDVQSCTPFVIVGPGFEPRRRRNPSLHVDLVPTLARWLYRDGLSIEHADGVDLRAVDAPRDVLLVTSTRKEWSLAGLRGERRLILRFQAPPLRPRFRVEGFGDHNGSLTPALVQSPQTIPAWVAALETLLR